MIEVYYYNQYEFIMRCCVSKGVVLKHVCGLSHIQIPRHTDKFLFELNLLTSVVCLREDDKKWWAT